MNVDFHDEAKKELMETSGFYERKASGFGSEFLTEIERLVSLIAKLPEIGKPWDHGTRRLSVRRFPFHMIYQILKESTLILAVAHNRRRPGYWSGRESA